jgi:hypothetical protein
MCLLVFFPESHMDERYNSEGIRVNTIEMSTPGGMEGLQIIS